MRETVRSLVIRFAGARSRIPGPAGEHAATLLHRGTLDVALSWVVAGARHCPVTLRAERGRRSGYTARRLLHHFWQLVLTSGTRPLRLIAFLGAFSIVAACAISAVVVYARLSHQIPVQGWTSTIIVLSFFAGAILVSLGVIAEYLGVAVSMAMGKPPYLIVSRPSERPRRP